MASIESCPHCGKEVARTDRTCPHCIREVNPAPPSLPDPGEPAPGMLIIHKRGEPFQRGTGVRRSASVYVCSCGFARAALPDADDPWSSHPFRPRGLPLEWLWQSQDGQTWDGENLACPKCAAELEALLLGKPH